MAPDDLPPVPDVLEKWRSEGTVKDINGYKIFVHASGPKSDHGVLIAYIADPFRRSTGVSCLRPRLRPAYG
jgi:hypothetical protein